MEIAVQVVWYLGLGLELVVGAVMARKKLYQECPVFFLYVLSQLLRFVFLHPLHELYSRSSTIYFNAYVGADIMDAILTFAVIYELSVRAFQHYDGIRELAWMLMRWAAIVLLLVAIVSASASPGTERYRLLAGLTTMERSINIVRAGLIVLLFLFHATLGMRWAKTMYGVAVGLGIITAVELVAYSLRANYGEAAAATLALISSTAYSCAAAAWLVIFLRSAPESVVVGRSRHGDIEDWNRALLELLHR